MTQLPLALRPIETFLDPAGARAAAIVEASFAQAARPTTPPFHRRISWAEFRHDGTILATVEMFDGRSALVECIPYGRPDGSTTWRHRWKTMTGGACAFERGQWRRVKEIAQ